MNYKQMLNKLAELETRIRVLEQPIGPWNTPNQTPYTPTWVVSPAWPATPDITYKGTAQ